MTPNPCSAGARSRIASPSPSPDPATRVFTDDVRPRESPTAGTCLVSSGQPRSPIAALVPLSDHAPLESRTTTVEQRAQVVTSITARPDMDRLADQPRQERRRKKAPVPHTALPRTLLAQSWQYEAGGPPETLGGRRAMTRKKRPKNQTFKSCHIETRGPAEPVSAEACKERVTYEPQHHTCRRCGQCPHRLWQDKSPPSPSP